MNNSLKPTLLIFLLIISFLVTAKNNLIKKTILHDGYNREFYIQLPINYVNTKTYPLIFALHGGGGTAKLFDRGTNYQFKNLCNNKEVIIVYPQGIGKSWNDGARDENAKARKLNIDDVGFFNIMLTQLKQSYSINSSAVFACGISNGGFMSITLAIQLNNQIRAVAAVAASVTENQLTQHLNKQPFNIMFIHGTSDPIVPYDGGEIIVFKKARGKVLGIKKSVEYMKSIKKNNLTVLDTNILDIDVTDGCVANKQIFESAQFNGFKMGVITISNGGHTWPKGKQYLPKKMIGSVTNDFSGAEEIWNFFESTL